MTAMPYHNAAADAAGLIFTEQHVGTGASPGEPGNRRRDRCSSAQLATRSQARHRSTTLGSSSGTAYPMVSRIRGCSEEMAVTAYAPAVRTPSARPDDAASIFG